MNSDKSDIQVSVCVVTYNQEKFIAECLDSIVNQEVNFKFEIIIGEDCSTDNTRNIVQRYADEHPDLIIPIFHEKNVGAVENIKQVYKKARGKYIAHIDGDDMMLSSKLAKQVMVLNDNPDCAICVHNMKAIDSNSEAMKEAFSIFKSGKYNLLDMYLINPFFIHSSKMFINKIESYIDRLDDNALDTEVHIEQAKQGDVFFIDEHLGSYRQFVGVTYHKNFISKIVSDRIQFIYENFDKDLFSNEEIERINEKYARILLEYAYQCAVSIKDKEVFRYYINKSVKVKNLGLITQIFKLSTVYPELFFAAAHARKKIKYRS